MRTPLISAIIPAYQCAETLGRSLDSALQQEYPALEVIIVDDGSTDTTRQVVAQYQARDPRIRYVWQTNQGTSSARNLAVRESSGEYLAFLDDDDEWRPGKLRAQAEILNLRPSVGLVFTDSLGLNTMNGRARPQSERYARALRALRQEAAEVFEDGFVLGPNLRRVLYQTNFIHTCSVVMRRTIIDKVGAFNSLWPEDYDLWMRATRATTFAYCAKLLSVHYTHSRNTSQTEAWFLGRLRYAKQCFGSPDYPDLQPDEARHRVRKQYRRLIFYYGRNSKPGQALAAYRSSREAGFDGLSALCLVGSFFGPLPFRLAGRLLWP